MDGFSNLFAAPPSYLPGLLGEEETERLRREAQQSGLMNLGLSLLAGAGPSPQRQGLGQLLAQGVMAGQQASRNAYEQAVRDRMMQEQIAEQRRVRAEQAETLRQQQVAQQMAQGLFVSPAAQLAQGLQRTGAEVTAAMPEASAMDVRMLRQPVPAAQTTGIDMDTLRNILINAPRAAAPYMQTVEQIQKLTPKPEDFVLGEGQIKYRMVGDKAVAIAGAPKEKPIQYQDLGDVVVGLQDGKEVFRQKKGLPPQGPVSKQLVETGSGYVVYDPKTTTVSPVTLGGKPLLGKDAKPTEGQLSTAGYAKRMAAAEQLLSAPSIATEAPGMGSAIAASVPFIGAGLETIIQSPETQSYRQAAKDWIRAKLRKESGAAIGVQEEAEEYRTYFPQPGDSDLVVEQKRQARIRATQGMVEASGSAFKAPESPGAPRGPRIPVDQMTPQQRAIEELKRRQKL